MYTRKKGGSILRHIQVIVALMATGALLVPDSGSSIVTVLCEGADGQVRVERAAQGACISDRRRDSERSTGEMALGTVQDGGDHCGPCTDIPLGTKGGQESSVLAQATRTQVKVPGLSVLLEMNAPTAAHVPPSARGSGGFTASPMLVHLRTVTLLI